MKLRCENKAVTAQEMRRRAEYPVERMNNIYEQINEAATQGEIQLFIEFRSITKAGVDKILSDLKEQGFEAYFGKETPTGVMSININEDYNRIAFLCVRW